MAIRISLFLAELKRRKVTRVAVVYALVGLGLIEGASMILPTLQLEEAYDYIVIIVLLGFPIALVLAWALEVTPQGIQKTPELTPEQLATQTPEKWRASSWLLAGLSLGAVATAGYFVFLRGGTESPLPEDYVAVFPFENLTGDPDLDEFGRYVAVVVTNGLNRAPEVRQVAASRVEEALSAQGDTASILETAKSLGVGIAVTGVIGDNGDRLEVSAEIIRVADGELIQTVEEQGYAEDPSLAVAALRDRVMGALALSLNETFLLGSSQPPTYESFQSYRRGMERWSTADYSDAALHFEDAFQQDSTQFVASIALFSAYHITQQIEMRDSLRIWLDSHRLDMDPVRRATWDGLVASLEGDLETVLEVARTRFRMDPTSNAFDLAQTAVRAGRPEEALQAFAQVDLNGVPFLRNFPPAWLIEPYAHHMLGSYEDELEAARQGIERFPEFLELRILELRALAAMGRSVELEPLLVHVEGMEPGSLDYTRTPGAVLREVAWELARVGNDQESRAVAERSLNWYLARDPERYQRARAEALLLLDQTEEALSLLKPLVEQGTENVFALIPRRGLYGVALARTGNREGAEAEALWLEEVDLPYLSGSNTRWRAAIVAHLGREDEAVRLLQKAFGEGQDYIYNSAFPYFKPLWHSEPFERLIAPKG